MPAPFRQHCQSIDTVIGTDNGPGRKEAAEEIKWCVVQLMTEAAEEDSQLRTALEEKQEIAVLKWEKAAEQGSCDTCCLPIAGTHPLQLSCATQPAVL